MTLVILRVFFPFFSIFAKTPFFDFFWNFFSKSFFLEKFEKIPGPTVYKKSLEIFKLSKKYFKIIFQISKMESKLAAWGRFSPEWMSPKEARALRSDGNEGGQSPPGTGRSPPGWFFLLFFPSPSPSPSPLEKFEEFWDLFPRIPPRGRTPSPSGEFYFLKSNELILDCIVGR